LWNFKGTHLTPVVIFERNSKLSGKDVCAHFSDSQRAQFVMMVVTAIVRNWKEAQVAGCQQAKAF